MISCSSDDDSTSENNKLLKKVESFNDDLFYDRTINYNSNNKIESIILNKYSGGGAPYTQVITVEYSGNSVSSINDLINYENPMSLDTNVTYNVSISNNLTVLTSEDVRIEITHSNGYVDSIIDYDVENSVPIRGSYLTRDSNQNLTTVVFNGGNVVNSYSDFDSDKKVFQYGGVIDVIYTDYIAILDLKTTANNPTTYYQSILGSSGPIRNHTFEYDEEGYITKIIEPNGVFYFNLLYMEE